MHLIAQCSNCGGNVRPELGVASTAATIQHRECADRFGIGTHGQSIPRDPSLRPERYGRGSRPATRPATRRVAQRAAAVAS